MKSFIEENQIKDLVAMIEEETNAFVVSNTSETDMDIILDAKFYDINMQEFLEEEEVIDFADDGDNDHAKLVADMGVFLRPGTFLTSSNSSTSELFRRKRVRFDRLKRKMRKVFCKTIEMLPELPEEWSLKKIIEKVVEAVMTFFKFGFSALLTAFVVNLLVKVVKGGLGRVCPV